MKKAAFILAVLLIASAAFLAGRAAGIRHAIQDSAIWTATVYNPDAPQESEWNGYDQQIFIDLDGERYEHGMIQC